MSYPVLKKEQRDLLEIQKACFQCGCRFSEFPESTFIAAAFFWFKCRCERILVVEKKEVKFRQPIIQETHHECRTRKRA